jgi:predicted RNA-binding protein with PIN domain
VARAGLASDPIVPPPPAMRPYLGFAKLGPRALGEIARIVEGDADFRHRVAAAVVEDDVGAAGWLWLNRPDGWQEELDEIVSRSEARDADERLAREERSATRRLAAAHAAAQRAEAAVVAGREALDAARAALADERARREAAEARSRELADAVAALTAARTEAVRQLKAAETRLVERSTELKALRARLREMDGAIGVAPTAARPRGSGADAVESAGEPGSPGGSGEADPGVAGAPASAPANASASPAAAAAVPDADAAAAGLDLADVAAEIARAARGAAALADGLAGLAGILGGERAGTADPDDVLARIRDDEAGAVAAPEGPAAPALAARPGGAAGLAPPRAGRRRPLELPGGVFDDTAEAAAHLLRTPGSVLIVDGYNASMTAWPTLAVADQRRRLIAALYDLALRTATPTEVVFDGAEVDELTVPTTGRRLVRARFSDPGIEADDVIIAMVDRLPATTPVIVASSDNRVREGARRGGANLLHSRQLVELLRR